MPLSFWIKEEVKCLAVSKQGWEYRRWDCKGGFGALLAMVRGLVVILHEKILSMGVICIFKDHSGYFKSAEGKNWKPWEQLRGYCSNSGKTRMAIGKLEKLEKEPESMISGLVFFWSCIKNEILLLSALLTVIKDRNKGQISSWERSSKWLSSSWSKHLAQIHCRLSTELEVLKTGKVYVNLSQNTKNTLHSSVSVFVPWQCGNEDVRLIEKVSMFFLLFSILRFGILLITSGQVLEK